MRTTNIWNKFNIYCGKVVVIVLLLSLISIVSSYGQQRRFGVNNPDYDERFLSYGFLIGLNTTSYQIKHADDFATSRFDSLVSIQPESAVGFALGFIVNMKLAEYLDFRVLPSVAFYEHELRYNYSSTRLSKLKETTMVELPMMFKYKSQRRANTRMYLIGGVKPAIEASGKNQEEDEGGEKVNVRKFDLSIDFGFGLDMYLPLFKFSPELRFSRGIVNKLASGSNEFMDPLQRVNTNTVTLYLLFQ